MTIDAGLNPSSGLYNGITTNSIIFSGVDESNNLDISDISKNIKSVVTD